MIDILVMLWETVLSVQGLTPHELEIIAGEVFSPAYEFCKMNEDSKECIASVASVMREVDEIIKETNE